MCTSLTDLKNNSIIILGTAQTVSFQSFLLLFCKLFHDPVYPPKYLEEVL